jgi:transcriptional regulator with XRE-family HTH domain
MTREREPEMAARLAEWRRSQNMTIEACAEMLGMTARSYRDWENGKSQDWSYFIFRRLGPYKANIGYDWLITGKGPMVRGMVGESVA